MKSSVSMVLVLMVGLLALVQPTGAVQATLNANNWSNIDSIKNQAGNSFILNSTFLCGANTTCTYHANGSVSISAVGGSVTGMSNPATADLNMGSYNITGLGQNESYSYLIWTDGTNYYAKNGSTGKVDFSGTNGTLLYDLVENSTQNGGTIQFADGTFFMNITISRQGIIINGNGRALDEANNYKSSTTIVGKITINNLFVTIQNLGNGGNGYPYLELLTGSYAHLDNIFVSGYDTAQIYSVYGNSNDFVIENSFIIGYVNITGNGITFKNNILNGNGGKCLNIAGAGNSVIDNDIGSCTNTIEDGKTVNSHGTIISENYFESTFDAGYPIIDVGDYNSGAYSITISENYFGVSSSTSVANFTNVQSATLTGNDVNNGLSFNFLDTAAKDILYAGNYDASVNYNGVSYKYLVISNSRVLNNDFGSSATSPTAYRAGDTFYNSTLNIKQLYTGSIWDWFLMPSKVFGTGVTNHNNGSITITDSTYNASYANGGFGFSIENGTSVIETGYSNNITTIYAGSLVKLIAHSAETGSINVSFWNATAGNTYIDSVLITAGTDGNKTLNYAFNDETRIMYNVTSVTDIKKVMITGKIIKS